MVHYAGYTPRFHLSDFETMTRDGVGADWPIQYAALRDHYALVERELPVAGQDWPWGDPHGYPFSPHPIGGAASKIWKGALACGIDMRVGPVGIVNGTFGNRPHCIYRGYCLQGCKVNAKASPTSPIFRMHWRTGSKCEPAAWLSRRARWDWHSSSGCHLCPGSEPSRAPTAGASRCDLRLFDRNTAFAPQLGFTRFSKGLCNNEDQVGRYVMVQGATHGRALSRGGAYVQGAPTRSLVRGFL